MSDVRGASGVPLLAAFGGQSASTPSTPLYVNLANGDLYVVINEVVKLVGSIPGGSSYIIAEQTMSNHTVMQTNVADSNTLLAEKMFNRSIQQPSAVIGDANTILMQEIFSPHPLPTMWS